MKRILNIYYHGVVKYVKFYPGVIRFLKKNYCPLIAYIFMFFFLRSSAIT